MVSTGRSICVSAKGQHLGMLVFLATPGVDLDLSPDGGHGLSQFNTQGENARYRLGRGLRFGNLARMNWHYWTGHGGNLLGGKTAIL